MKRDYGVMYINAVILVAFTLSIQGCATNGCKVRSSSDNTMAHSTGLRTPDEAMHLVEWQREYFLSSLANIDRNHDVLVKYFSVHASDVDLRSDDTYAVIKHMRRCEREFASLAKDLEALRVHALE